MIYRSFRRASSALLILACSYTSSSCGNAWITASEREQTLAAIMSKAEYAYDKGRFEESERLFRQALDKDPSYRDARIKLAYASNAVAGLSILDFVMRFVVQEEGDAAKTNETSGSLSILTDTVGLSAEEAESLRSKNLSNISELRANSAYLAKLHESWQTICPLISSEVFDSVFSQAPDNLKETFGISSCENGLGPDEAQSSAASFSAALQFMAQAAALFQTSLDANGDNEIDLVSEGLNAFTELQKLNDFSSRTDPSTVDATEYASNLSAISTQLDSLQNLKSKIDGEVINYALTCFTFISALVARIPNMPSEVTKKIERAIAKINEGQTKLSQYTSYDGGSKDSSQGAKVKEAAQKASTAIDTLYSKVNDLPDGAEKTERLAELDKQKEQVCQNFEETKNQFNLPDDVATPSQCSDAAFLVDHHAQGTDNKVESYHDFKTRNRSFKPIPLPSELNISLNMTDGAQGDEETDFKVSFLNFVRFGGSLRQ